MGDDLHWTTHVTAGAAVGYLTGRPVPALLLGFASHVALDTFPHHDPDSDIPYVVDSVVGMIALVLIGKSRTIRRTDPKRAAFWGALGAGLPDLELLAKLVTTVEQEDYLYPTHNGLIPHRQMPALYSGITQVALVAFLTGLALLKWKRRRVAEV